MRVRGSATALIWATTVCAACGSPDRGDAGDAAPAVDILGDRESSDAAAADAPPDSDPRRRLTFTVRLRANGVSDPVDFVVPETTRSVTIVATGASASLYALASFRMADGIERVDLDPAGGYGPEMEASYVTDMIGAMPGSLFQSIRLGTFTHVYPYAPGQAAVAGPAQLRIASNAVEGDVTVTVLMPLDDGATTLHINVVTVSDTITLSEPLAFLDEARSILGQVGLRLVVDETLALRGSEFNRISDSSEPQERPESGSARLALFGSPMTASDALNVYVVDSLPAGIAGLSLGTPGVPLAQSYYFGILLRYSAQSRTLGRVFAHEAAHFLALQHVENRSASGRVFPDPLDDTAPGQNNLMETGTLLTQAQGFALSRSALLSRE